MIRTLSPDDAPAIARLCTELGYPASEAEVRDRLAGLMGHSDHAVFVAEIDGQVVGWAHVCAVSAVEFDPCAQLAGLVVSSNRRGEGIGATLVRAAESWASERGFSRIFLRSNVSRAAAHRFYRALGYETTKTSHFFEKSFGGARSESDTSRQS